MCELIGMSCIGLDTGVKISFSTDDNFADRFCLYFCFANG